MYDISFENFSISEDVLWKIRKDIYHSEGTGFIVLRNFISDDLVSHLRLFWSEFAKPDKTHRPLSAKSDFYNGCGCYFADTKFQKTYFNPLWSNTFEPVSNEVSFVIAIIRAKIEGKAIANDCMPIEGRRCVVPRVVQTFTCDNPLVAHSDYGISEKDANNIDLARIQGTLFLSEFDLDYKGSGFLFTKNNGETIALETELDLKPGDLVCLRYTTLIRLNL